MSQLLSLFSISRLTFMLTLKMAIDSLCYSQFCLESSDWPNSDWPNWPYSSSDLFLMILGSELVFLYTYSFICSWFHLSITANAVLLCSLPGDGFLLCLHCYELLFVNNPNSPARIWKLTPHHPPLKADVHDIFWGTSSWGAFNLRKFLDITSNFKLEAHIIIVMKVL